MIKDFKLISKKGEGTFSEVLKCQNVKTKEYFACKKMKQHYETMEQVNNLREIQAMRKLNPHDNILMLHEVIFDRKSGILCLILELMDLNLYELIRGRKNYLPEFQVKNYMWQLFNGLNHIHSNGIFHRDVKPENILIRDQILKIADFGSCKSIFSKHPYTEYISTRWYRAPECLLTDGYYSFPMDVWSVGCVLFEVLSLKPLFPGVNELDQITKIHEVFGTPDPTQLKTFKKSRSMSFNFPAKKGTGIEKMLFHVSPDAINLIKRLCEYDPNKRISSQMALRHSYFKEFRTSQSVEIKENIIQRKPQRKSSKSHILIETKENQIQESNSKQNSSEGIVELPVMKSSLSNTSKSPQNLLSPYLVKRDNQAKLKEITLNSSRISDSNKDETQYFPVNVSKKKQNRFIHENSNSKPWLENSSQSFLPKIYLSSYHPLISSNSFFTVPYLPKDATKNLKISKQFKKNQNSVQWHSRFQLKPAFK